MARMTPEETDPWDLAAERYRQEQEHSAFASVNRRMVTGRFRGLDLKGKALLDLGCGYGWYTHYFHSVGAKAVGCDGSAEMLRLARSQYPDIPFERVDLLEELPYGDERFDVVFCNQVLMDIPCISGLIKEVGRITAEGGLFYVSLVHPAFYDARWQEEDGFGKVRIMERYLSEYSIENGFWGSTRHYHRTLSSYLNTILRAGFRLLHVEEPETYDGVCRSAEFPLFFAAEFQKDPRPGHSA